MTVRSTSAETYRNITDDGLIAKQLLEVYRALYERGPCTGTELSHYMAGGGPWDPGDSSGTILRNKVSRRMADLRSRGVVVELEPRECTLAGTNQIVWQTTDELPDSPAMTARRVMLKTIRRWLKAADNAALLPLALAVGYVPPEPPEPEPPLGETLDLFPAAPG